MLKQTIYDAKYGCLEFEVASHINFLTKHAWQERKLARKRDNQGRRLDWAAQARYRFMRLEIGWLRAMVAEQVPA